MKTKVSVIMPVYNSEKYLREAIESILDQTYSNFEIIIINDGSTDESMNIINEYTKRDSRIKVFNNDGNKGLPYTRNRGLELAEGEYIALLDSDDVCYRNRFYEQVNYLDKNNNVMVVATGFDYLIDDKVHKIKTTTKKMSLKEENIYLSYKLMFGNPILNSSAMFRKEFIDNSHIKYREELFVAQDYAFWLECKQKGNFHVINKPLIQYRKGHENITKKSGETKREKRKKLIDSLRLEAVKNNNFILNKDEEKIINKVFSDPYISIDEKDVDLMAHLINKLTQQITDTHNKKIFAEVAKYELIGRVKRTKIKLMKKFDIAINTFHCCSNKSILISLIRVIK